MRVVRELGTLYDGLEEEGFLKTEQLGAWGR